MVWVISNCMWRYEWTGHAKFSVMQVRLALRSADENQPESYLKTQSVPRSKHLPHGYTNKSGDSV